jgi:hypothetical protein
MTRYRHTFFALAVFALALVAAPAFALDRGTAEVELAQAFSSVQAAERDDAAHYAAADLDEAHTMLDEARRAQDARAWTDVGIYAERAKVSGDLASARARQHRAESATAEIERSVETLRNQLRVSGGAL